MAQCGYTCPIWPQEAPRGRGDGEPGTETGQEQGPGGLIRARTKGTLVPKVSSKRVEDSVYPALLSWKDDWELYPLAWGVLKTGV